MTSTLSTDHPGWHTGKSGNLVRLVLHDDVPWLAVWEPGTGLRLSPIGSDDATAPPAPRVSPHALPNTVAAAPLVRRLVALGDVQRLTNPSLWDALTSGFLRQIVIAGQARLAYRRWCTKGQCVETPAGPLFLVPDAESVLNRPDEEFMGAGTKFQSAKLRTAAVAYLKHGSVWKRLAPDELVRALQEIPGIGPWTAGAVAADYTGDFSLYPHGDPAIRGRVSRVLPGVSLPARDEALALKWRGLANHSRRQLHALTLYTLTWGTGARSDVAQALATSHRPFPPPTY